MTDPEEKKPDKEQGEKPIDPFKEDAPDDKPGNNKDLDKGFDVIDPDDHQDR